MPRIVSAFHSCLAPDGTTQEQMYSIEAYYSGTSCEGTPFLVNANQSSNCSSAKCSSNNGNATTSTVGMISFDCASDYLSAVRSKFGKSPYIIQVYSPETDCSTFGTASGFPASGNCEGSYSSNDTMGVHLVGTLEENGSATMEYYSGSPCLNIQWVLTESVDKETLENHSCDANRYTWYSSNDDICTSSSLSTGAIVGITIGCLVVAVAIGCFAFQRRRTKKLLAQSSLPLTTAILQSDDTIISEQVRSGRSGLWNDDIIIARHVPRDKVKVKKLINRGAYGEVYAGVFNRKQVAVKMLVPATRNSLQQANDFLAEAKLTASMDHPHIVSFIGVAWDSLSDLCILLEYMDGGDLRSLFDKYLVSNHPIGIDRQKLESLSMSVTHSRVGTSLWIAPEVMLGEKYDDKADVFSFGVVLSELDVHTLPYAQVRRTSDGSQMVNATLLQRITSGKAQVEFSESSPTAIVQLGRACVSLNPNDRPSAAEALYKLHVFLAQIIS
ncbi:unnamed protein product [Phytophthora lilii]|uniref:Unnamed protein product n=1 Tax=Phytophthora lilii TaxID=2077276 RepID=A0A9W6TTJ0_9STRA|nr:unnamed protein product [Phytophthora lilii]